MYRGEMAKCHPPFANDSDAALIVLSGSLPADTLYINYSPDDDIQSCAKEVGSGECKYSVAPAGNLQNAPARPEGCCGFQSQCTYSAGIENC